MKRYTVVIFQPLKGEEIKVEVRNYEAVPMCFACGQLTAGANRQEAARQAGHDFGEMLLEYGSQEFRRELLQVLRV